MLEAQINQTTEKIAQLKQTYTEEKQTLDQLLQKKQTKEQKINNLRHQLTTEQDDLATQIEELKSDRKSTRLNSSHVAISYAVFCLKKKKLLDILYLIKFNKSSVN